MKTELNSKNRITVSYSFNIINWNLSETKRLYAKIRKMFTISRIHHPKADVERLHVPRKEGGRGLIQLELMYKTSTIGLYQYLSNSNDWILQLVNQHENSKKLHSVVKEANKFTRELEIEIENENLQIQAPTENLTIQLRLVQEDNFHSNCSFLSKFLVLSKIVLICSCSNAMALLN